MDEPAPPDTDGGYQQLDPRSIQVQRIAGWIFTACFGAASLAGLGIALLTRDDMPGWLRPALPLVWVAAITLMAWHTYWWAGLDYRHTSFRLDAQGLEIRRGVFWRVVINIPRSRVQHTDVSQGPLERRYGLGTLVIYTAGTDHARVGLSGLEHGVALRSREQLLPSGGADAV